jgi:hypothetical protein
MAESFDPRVYARQMAAQYGVDPDIFTKMLFAESSFDPNAKSVVRGRDYVGYGQLGEAAAQDVGITDRFDPKQNIEGSAKYLKMQLDEFGSYPLALAAYNAGPARVRKYNGIPPFAETQAYIEKIMGNNTMNPNQAILTSQSNAPSSAPVNAPIDIVPESMREGTPVTPALLRRIREEEAAKVASQAAAPDPNDPYANLSKTQRRMLSFAAIKDAGMALQGLEGRSVENLLSDFTTRADQARKAKAAQARQQMMQQMFGGGDTMGGGMTGGMDRGGGDTMGGGMTGGMDRSQMSPEQMRARAQQLAQFQAMNPDVTLTPMIDMLVKEADRIEATQKAQTAAATGAGETLETIEDLLRAVREKEGTTGVWGMIFGQVPFTEAGQLRIDVQTLRSNMALDALMSLKASGATLGSVSEKELELLESDIQKLNLNQKKEKVLDDLNKIKRRYQKAIRSAYLNIDDKIKLDQALGGRPAWLEGDPEAEGQQDPLGILQ